MEDEQQLYQPTRMPVQEAPSKFWQSVEPYCQPIQPETIKMLEQMYQTQQDNEDYFKVWKLNFNAKFFQPFINLIWFQVYAAGIIRLSFT